MIQRGLPTAGIPGPQKNGQQFGIGQGARPFLDQFFAGTIRFRPVFD